MQFIRGKGGEGEAGQALELLLQPLVSNGRRGEKLSKKEREGIF